MRKRKANIKVKKAHYEATVEVEVADLEASVGALVSYVERENIFFALDVPPKNSASDDRLTLMYSPASSVIPSGSDVELGVEVASAIATIKRILSRKGAFSVKSVKLWDGSIIVKCEDKEVLGGE